MLVGEDEDLHIGMLRQRPTAAGHPADVAEAGRVPSRTSTSPRRDAIVVDVVLPDVDGLEVCHRRHRWGIPTTILPPTAKDAVADRAAGLDAGADD